MYWYEFTLIKSLLSLVTKFYGYKKGEYADGWVDSWLGEPVACFGGMNGGHNVPPARGSSHPIAGRAEQHSVATQRSN